MHYYLYVNSALVFLVEGGWRKQAVNLVSLWAIQALTIFPTAFFHLRV